MFRKAQLRLFGIITAILLAIFIGVLSSVNLIMGAVMERQSKDVLRQIAAGVEYDDSTSNFTYVRPGDYDPRHDDKYMHQEEPPSKPAGEPGTDETKPSSTDSTAPETTETETETQSETSTAATTTVHVTETDAAAAVTEYITEEQPPEVPENSVPRETETQPPAPTEPAKPTPTQPIQTQPPATTTAVITQPPAPTAPAPTEPLKPGKEKEDPEKRREDEKKPNFPGGYNWGEPGKYPSEYPKWGQPYDGWWCYQDEDDNNNAADNDDNDDDNAGSNTIVPPVPPRGWYPYWEQANLSSPAVSYSSVSELYGEPVLLAYAENATSNSRSSIANGQNVPPSQRNGVEPVPKSLGSIDFFVVMADTSGNYLATLNNDDLDQNVAQQYITEILKKGASSGMLNNYQFYSAEKDNGTLFVFTDKTGEMDMRDKLLRTTIIIGAVSLLFLLAAAYFLSRQVMKPLKTAFEKQKQFISDASHELKTPLTVISANADVLSGEIGNNKWLEYIKSQTDRMNVLVNDLLNLTRLENNTSDFIRTDFDLSKAIVNTALPFECQAFESSKDFEVDVEEGITVNGSERHIKQMAAIFIDNALKYSNDGGKVRVSLKKQGEKKVLSIYNTGQGVKDEEKDKIFERFYRSDESRNRATGGYGLGLAIAKSIIDKHKFKVSVENEEGKSICFVVTM